MNPTIKLSAVNTNNLRTYLDRKFSKANGSMLECEIRFGSFIVKSKVGESYQPKEFSSKVEIDFFYRLQNALQKQTIQTTASNTKDLIFESAIGKIRETLHLESGTKDYLMKNTINKHDIYEYDCRIGLSTEKPLTEDEIKGINLNSPSFVRYKKRISYELYCGSIDMTIVNQGTTDDAAFKNTHYEVEFEVTKNDLESITQVLTFIMQVRQNNTYVINTNEKKHVKNEYWSLTKKSFFVGAQPETLQKDQLSMLFKELYSVTDKADGERYFMMVDTSGIVWFIDSNIQNILKTDLKSVMSKTILDGELIKDDQGKTTFYAFDILFHKGMDLRGKSEYWLKARLEMVDSVVKTVNPSDAFVIKMKDFIYRNVFMGAEMIMKDIDNKPYKNDGLIFTPVNEPYPIGKSWKKLLKWKPAELNTIDFFSVKQGNIWQLFVQHANQQTSVPSQVKSTKLVLFDVETLCGNNTTKTVTFETTFDDSLQDPTTNEPYKTNTVIEFRWDEHDNKFVPLRTRWDKTANPNKHGNFSTVACSIWNNINNPITSSQLFQMTNATTGFVGGSGQKPFFFERMTAFHNKVTQYLFSKYTIDINEPVIELNTFNQIKSQNTYTFCDSIKQSNPLYKNLKVDLTNSHASGIVKNNLPGKRKVKTLFCLKLNRFFESLELLDNFINILDSNLEHNGKVIVSFVDYNRVKEATTESFIDNEIMYLVDAKLTHHNFNNYVKLFVNGVCNESEPLEYLLDYTYFVQYMSDKGYNCVESEDYEHLYQMMKGSNCNEKLMFTYEEDISKLFKFCVFEKTNVCISDTVQSKPTCQIIKNSEEELQFFRIQTLYDVFDVLNCLCFSIFNSNHDNKDINCFEDIQIPLKHIQPSFNGSNCRPSHSDYIYVHNHKYVEHKDDPADEPIVFSQFYIVLLKYKVIQSAENINYIHGILENTKLPLTNNDKRNENVEVVSNAQNDMKQSIIAEINESRPTVAKLKEYLKSLNCKTSGNKDELIQRLNVSLK